jgi:ElaB/YqjD/DUF883 family membrane-anchored ribosome-binding protein
MKTSELRSLIREEIKKVLNSEGKQITPEFEELKKQQAAIKDQQNYLIKMSDSLKIDKKLTGDYNKALNSLLDAIFKASYDKDSN